MSEAPKTAQEAVVFGLRAGMFSSHPEDPKTARYILEALRALPVDDRMEAMGMVLASHRFLRREGVTEDDDAWWGCAVCGAYETNSLHNDRWIERPSVGIDHPADGTMSPEIHGDGTGQALPPVGT